MHTYGAEGLKIVHPAICHCVQTYIMYRDHLNKVHSIGAHVPKCVHSAIKVCTLRAGCTLDTIIEILHVNVI